MSGGAQLRAATGRAGTVATMGVREFVRTPVLLALLVFLPAYVIGVFVWLVPDTRVPVSAAGGTVSVPMTDFAAAFMTPVTVAILSGVVGLFLMHSSRAGDDRLRLAGIRATELVAARVGTLAAGTAVATAASLAVALATFAPDSLVPFVGATLLAGLTYGLLGVIVGIVLNRLPGVYVMLFGPMVDVLMFQNPLATDSPAWTTLLPGHYATNLLFDAAFAGDVALADLFGAVGYVLALLAVGTLLLYRASGVE